MRSVFIIIALCVVSACATPSGPTAEATATNTDDDAFSLTGLVNAALPIGKCGMILWTLDANTPTPILRYVAGEGAVIAINGSIIDLTLAESAGGGNFGVFERQVFIGGSGYDASVDVDFGPGFDGGVYLERGLISVKAENGWEVIAPSAGIAGCRRK